MAARLRAFAASGEAMTLVAACVGERAAQQLRAFERIADRVPVARIVRDGLRMDFRRGSKSEPSFVYAAVFAVAAFVCSEPSVTDEQLSHVVRFARSPGLDPEYVFLFLRQLKRAPEVLARLRTQPAFQTLASQMVALHVSLYR